MPSPSTHLYDLAVSRLRDLFPESRLVRELSKPAPATAKAANTKPTTTRPTAIASGRCSEKACVYPSYSNGKCRQHLADAEAECSTLPSLAGPLISGHLGF
jgi:hypothetical protein